MIKTRIAPSPTGDPHVGTIYQALLNRVFAHQNGGKFILRIEDTDRTRFNPDSQRRLLEMLEWVGLPADESPTVGGPAGSYIQTERVENHRRYAAQMLENGTAYRAFDTSAELEERRKLAEAQKASYRGYDRRDRNLSAEESAARAATGEPFVVRIKAPLEGQVVVHDRLRGDVMFQATELDDKVLLKADGFPTYHLAAMSDDFDMGVTHVIRAEEWLTSTPIHKLIIQAMGWSEPEWIHTPLLRNPDKSKLSKRKSNTSVESYKDMGIAPEALLNYLGMMAFSMPDGRELFTVADLEQHFTWERVSLGGPVFDLGKLTWLNGRYIREVLTLPDVVARGKPYLEQAGFDVSDAAKLEKVVHALRPRFDLFSDLPQKAAYFYNDIVREEKAAAKLEEGKPHLAALFPLFETQTAWDGLALEAAIKTYAESTGAKLGAVMQPLRAALTGKLESPGMVELLEALGRDLVLERVRRVLD
jgi:glutamyl-tRNA synthetase